MTIGKRVLYTGRVQGVGFRYTAKGVAQTFAVAGFVRNVPDGRVELVAEGEAVEVDHFLASVAEHMADYIDGQTTEDVAPEGLSEFAIRR
jgi:acylphosphatase